MKKPLTIEYGVEETPPPGVMVFSGLQHVVLIAIRLLFPLLVAREAGLAPERVLDMLGVSMIVMAVATLLQAMPRGPVGCRYLCPPSFTSAYIAPSLVAARTGGLSLVVGMTLFGGVIESGLSRLLRPLRPFFPAEIAGFVGTVSALLLNAVFRLGVRRTQTLVVHPADLDTKKITDFMEAQGAAWGARRDVIDRASFNLAQSIETIVEGCDPEGPLEIEASFDEFSLDLRVSYAGTALELPDRRPTNEEIMASEEGQRKLAGFMLRRHADRVQSAHRAGRSTILFHFDH